MSQDVVTQNLLKSLIDHSLKNGASEVDAKLSSQENLTYGQRMGQAESIERANAKTLKIRLYKGKKKQVLQTSHLDETTLKDLISNSLNTLNHLPEDPYCGLAAPDQIMQGERPNLRLSDPYEPSEKELINLLDETEKASLSVPQITNNRGGKASWHRAHYHHISSNGFEGAYDISYGAFYVQPIAGSDENMQIAHDFSQSVFFHDLKDPEEVGKKAAKKACDKLNPSRVKTGSYPIIFDKEVSNQVIGIFMNAISGNNIARGVSFLKTSLNEKLCDYEITLIDEPHLEKGLGSRLFDGEGFGLSNLTYLKDGVLQYWNLGLTAARQLDLVDHKNFPLRGTASTTNLTLKPGSQSVKKMMADKGTGLLIDNIMSHPDSLANGDYSVGASGFYFENGEIIHPVNEITLSGNVKDMLKAMIPASDLPTQTATRIPSLYVGEMSVGGI